MRMLDFNYFFDRIFIINLESMNDRRERISMELTELGIRNYEFFNACRPENVKDYPDSYVNNFSQNLVSKSQQYSRGALGCKLSHYEIIKKAIELNMQRILILEDDCQILKNGIKYYWPTIASQLDKQLIDWHMFYLSANMHTEPSMVGDYISVVSEAYTTHSYALNLKDSKFVDNLLQSMLSSGLEIDVFYSREIQNNYNAYIAIPALSCQLDGYSSIREVEKNYTVKILKHGQAMNKSLLHRIIRSCLGFLKYIISERRYNIFREFLLKLNIKRKG